METSVANEGENLKGLCVYGNASNILVWGIEGEYLKLYKQEKEIKTELFSQAIFASKVYLRIESVNARFFCFYWSENQKDWYSCLEQEDTVDGAFLPQWGKGLRAGLIVENKGKDNSGVFSYFSSVSMIYFLTGSKDL
jgi:hypothetical protein